MKAIIVDDSFAFRARLKNILTRSLGITVVADTNDGREVMELIGRHRPDILILDLVMPIISGLKVLQELKQNSVNIMIVVVSNYAEKQVRAACQKLGAHFVFDKSTEFEEMIDTIEKLKGSKAPPSSRSERI